MLLQQLSENPLPRDMFPGRMPRELKSQNTSVGSNIVTVEKDDSATWWDVLQKILVSKKDSLQTCTFPAPMMDQVLIPINPKAWNEDMFEYSIVAIDILCLGLQLLKRAERQDLVSGSWLPCGLFRCAFAARTVSDRVQNVRLKTTSGMHCMETEDNFGSTELELEYLTMLASSLAQCTEQLLMLCLKVCDSKENGNQLFFNQIVVAIEASGVDNVSLSILSEERSNFIAIICEEIKKLCK
mmetsp:Transcript_5097/g.11485  ORF Transcript_5097/g.11485 Transcript_5097/m.11485 type:complete len:241 (+) Transcript_5097:626-1348(+)